MTIVKVEFNEKETQDIVRALTQVGALVTDGPGGGTQTGLTKIREAAKEAGVRVD